MVAGKGQSDGTPDDRLARGLLIAGTAAGIALAGFGLLRSGDVEAIDSDGAVAVVNGRPLSREAFARFVGAVARERRVVNLGPEGERRLLDRMIDEELLLQRGIDLDLPRIEPTARRSIVAALIASVAADAELVEPDVDELRAFHSENPDRFTRQGRLDLRAAFVDASRRPDAAALRTAREIERRLRAGEDFESVRRELADAPVAPLPEGLLPPETVRQYLGPLAATTASRMKPGEVSEPQRASAGYHVLMLRDRVPGELIPLSESRGEVRAEYLRRRGDAALREYLDGLRDSGDVRILDPELASS